MSNKLSFFLKPGKNSYRFPSKCVYCGSLGTIPLVYEGTSLKRLSMHGDTLSKTYTYAKYSVTLLVPYCSKHHNVSQIAKPALAIASTVGFLLGLTALLAVATSANAPITNSTLVVILLLICGFGGSILASWLTKAIIAKLLDKSFRKVPMWTYWSGFKPPYTLGMGVDIFGDKITFSFENEQIREEFESLNK